MTFNHWRRKSCDGKCVPYTTSSHKHLQEGFSAAGLSPGDLVVDLGCGTGEPLIVAATEFGANGVGYEIDEYNYKIALNNVRKAGVSNKVIIKNESFMNAAEDVDRADLVYAYLLPSVIEEHKDLLARAHKLLTLSFPVEGWRPTKIVADRLFFYDRVGGKSLQDSPIHEESSTLFKSYESYVNHIFRKYQDKLRNKDYVTDVYPIEDRIVVVSSQPIVLPDQMENVKIVNKA